MKKLSILLIGLLLATGFAFGQPEVGLAGSATMTFGVDLDDGATGISNAISLDTWVTWFDQTQSTEGDGVYGMIELNGMRFVIQDGAWNLRASRVTAKLVVDPLYIKIYGDGGVGTSYDESVDSANLNSRVSFNIMGLDDMVSNDYSSEFMGIAIGAALDVATVEAYVQSEYDWIDSGSGDINTANAYALGVYASVSAVENLSLSVEADMGVNYATNPIGVGAAVGYTVDISDTMSLVPNAGFDLVSDAGATDYEADFGVALGWPGTSGWSYHWSNGWANHYSGLEVSGIYYSVGGASDMGIQVSTFEDAAEGLVPTVGWAIEAEVVGLTSTPDVGVAAYLDAAVDPAWVYGAVEVANALSTPTLDLLLGVELSGLVDYTTFTLEWDSGDLLLADPVLGVVTFATKISL